MLSLSFLSGCANSSMKHAALCYGWQPIYITIDDLRSMSDSLARDILKHNRQGQTLCGWGE